MPHILANVFYCNYLATAKKRIILFIYAFHVSISVSDVYSEWSHSPTTGLKIFCSDTKKQIWKRYKTFSQIIFLSAAGNSSAYLYYRLHLFRPFKWGFCLHVHNGDFAFCLTFIHLWKKFKEIHHKGPD